MRLSTRGESNEAGIFSASRLNELGPPGEKLLREDCPNFGHGRWRGEFGGEGSDGAIGAGDAAGDDPGKMLEMRRYVEGEAVVSDPTTHRDADGGDFAGADPDAGEAVATGRGETEAADGTNHHFLQKAKVGVQVFDGRKVDDRIADDLAGTVISDVAAAIGVGDRNALGGELSGGPEQVFHGSVAQTYRVNRVVFGEYQLVGYLALDALTDEDQLAGSRLGVSRASPVFYLDTADLLHAGKLATRQPRATLGYEITSEECRPSMRRWLSPIM